MTEFSSYGIIIAGSLLIIVSYLFNRLADKTSIPSVLLLIILGIIVKQVDQSVGFLKGIDLFPILEILGIIGLIMIVLEAALDLKLSRDKKGLILKSMALALLGLLINAGIIAWIIKSLLEMDWYVSFIYAIPLAIMSSAIIIPSVANLASHKKEFMIYESTFSDIFGIMLFYFFLGADHGQTSQMISLHILSNILITIAVSFASSYLLIFLFQNIHSATKFFLMIAVLVFLYSIGKQLHLSSLLIVLVFGLVLSNQHLFIRGKLKKFFNMESLAEIHEDFVMVTQETSFIVRTFFFFIFGLSIALSSLMSGSVLLISFLILGSIYGSRHLLARLILKKDLFPEWLIAPRGLITILLFYGIPKEYQFDGFQEFQGILLFVILFSSVLMGYSLIRSKKADSKAIVPLEIDENLPEEL